jgi:CBS domain-containing protein
MKVSECMSRDVETVSPEDTIQYAARMMAQIDAGVLPVHERGRLVGVITDRDIAIRGVGAGQQPDARVDDVMTREVKYCFEEDEVDDVLDNMADIQLRRLPVVSRDKRLVGIVSLSDMAAQESAEAGKALSDIARPSALHSQTL